MRTADPRPLFLVNSSPPCGSLISRITSNQFRRNSSAGTRLRGRTLVSGWSKCPVMTENFAYLSRREATSHESRMHPERAACGPLVSRDGLGTSPSDPAQLPVEKAENLTDLSPNLHLRLRNADLPPSAGSSF